MLALTLAEKETLGIPHISASILHATPGVSCPWLSGPTRRMKNHKHLPAGALLTATSTRLPRALPSYSLFFPSPSLTFTPQQQALRVLYLTPYSTGINGRVKLTGTEPYLPAG